MEQAEIIFDGRVFSVEAVKSACYRLAGLFDAEIVLDGDSIVCRVTLRASFSQEAMNEAFTRLRREVIDHDLRIRIRNQTEPVRNLILASAFSRTGLISSE